MQQQTDCGCKTHNKWHVDKPAVWGSHGTRHRKRERRWWGEDAEVSNVQTGLTRQISLGAATQAAQPAAVVGDTSFPSTEPSLRAFPWEPDLPGFNQGPGHTVQKSKPMQKNLAVEHEGERTGRGKAEGPRSIA